MLSRLVEAGARTWTYDLLSSGNVPSNALCITRAPGFDDRSDLPVWSAREAAMPGMVIRLMDFERDECRSETAGVSSILRYRSDISIRGVLQQDLPICIDITSLPMSVWSPLVRVAIQDDRELWLVYAEPGEYQAHKSPTPPELFDLSERVGDVEALPGMARLVGPSPGRPLLLAIFLGFEGGRARHITTTLDPEPTIIPVVAVPGMHAEFATQAVECNREFLKNTEAFSYLRWVDSVCPFSVRDLLRDIAAEHSDSYMYIAPIGTKPHAAGALLYALEEKSNCQIIYDHPTPRKGGTSGIGKTHLYRVN